MQDTTKLAATDLTPTENLKRDLNQEKNATDTLCLDILKSRENDDFKAWNGEQKPYTGHIYNAGNLFITGSVEDIQCITEATDAYTNVVAFNLMTGMDFVNTIECWRSTYIDNMGTVIFCLDNTEASFKKSLEMLHELHKVGLKGIIYNLCKEYKTPHEAAAADPAQFAQDIQQAQEKAKAARLPDDLDDFLKKIQTRRYEPHATGLQFFDDLLAGGVIDGTTLIMTGPPATGKTTLCLQLATAMAAHKTPVVYLNFEMSNDQMLAKVISCQLAASGNYYTTTKILQGYTWNDADRETITVAVDEYRKTTAPFLSFKPPTVKNDLDAVLSYLQELGDAAERSGKHAPAIFLDYLHIIRTDRHMDTKDLIGRVVYGVKDYADRYNTFAVLIAAQSRDANKKDASKKDKEPDKKEAPTMADARDSSNIEYSGDYVMSLWAVDATDRTPQRLGDKNTTKPKERQMELYLLKNRFGKSNLYTQVSFNPAANYFFVPVSPVAGFTPYYDDEQITMDQSPKRKRL